jgi:AraC-like DNA-binding protein
VPVVDVLADLLDRARARGGVFALSTLGAPWGIELADGLPVSIHVVLKGEAWFDLGDGPVHLLQGDVALMATDATYSILHEPGAACLALDQLDDFLVPGTHSSYRWDGGGATTVLLCGAYRFHGDLCDSLVECLPPLVVLRAGDGPGSASLRAAVTLLADEVAGDLPGRTTVLDRLLDILLVHVLRDWFAREDTPAPAWYRALADPEIGRALRMVHGDPAAHWTLEGLAAAVGLSRAAFARRFKTLVGLPPLAYVAGWRMSLAAEALRDTDDTVAQIARRVGYDNEFAFSTAFRRHHGDAPSRFRVAHRSSHGTVATATSESA